MIEQQFTFQCDAADCTEHFTALDVTIHQAITEVINQGWYVMTMAGKPELTGLFVTCPVHNPAAKARKRAEAEARKQVMASIKAAPSYSDLPKFEDVVPNLSSLAAVMAARNRSAAAEVTVGQVTAVLDKLDAKVKEYEAKQEAARGFAAAVSIPRGVAVARMAMSRPFEAICGVDGCYHAASQHKPHLGTYRCDAHATVTP